jgi:ribonuclease-3
LDKANNWLEEKLNYRFDDVDLFRQALTHRSAAGKNNERLEFLGDAVLDFVISEALYRTSPDADEGDLSRLRASLVRDASLAGIAVELGIGEHLYLGGGERKSGGHRRDSILADALEAILGAVYLDRGFEAARELIERLFSERLQNLPHVDELRDPKTRLQEWLQARQLPLPDYELIEVKGQAHKQTFRVRGVVAGQEVEASGKGTSRRNAEQQAAERLLRALRAADKS